MSHRINVRDVNGREHVMLWPFIVLMLVMGVASPYWMRAITPAVAHYAAGTGGRVMHGVLVEQTISPTAAVITPQAEATQ